MESKKKIIVGILVVLITAYFGIKVYAEKEAEKKINKAIADVAQYVDVNYDDVDVDLLGLNAHVNHVVISPAGEKEKIEIDDIAVFDIDDKNDIPSYIHIRFKGININVDNIGDGAKELNDLGYQNLKANIEVDYGYDLEKKELYLNKLNFGADEVGELNLEFHLGNIDLTDDNIASILFTFSKILIYEANLSYKDDSLITRIQKKAAKENGEDMDTLISKLTSDIDKEISKAKDKFSKNSLTAVKKFIEKPKNISISISPNKPLPVGRLQRAHDTEKIIEMLNAEVRT